MAAIAHELAQVAPSLFVWQTYDPAIKADLSSTGLVTPQGILIIDPVKLVPDALHRLEQRGQVAGIIVTNANHHRAAIAYAEQFAVPLFAHAESFPAATTAQVVQIGEGATINDQIDVIEIAGAPAGELAIHCRAGVGTLIVGDALINFEPHGFGLLPRKYCRNQKQMRRALRKLLDCNAERMLFAHGTPILSGATLRLRHLLEEGSAMR